MNLSPVRCAYLLLLINFAYSGRVLRKMKQHVFRAQHQRAKDHLMFLFTSGKLRGDDVKEGVIQRPMDPFDVESTETFPQRYFVNEAYWDSPHGPVFLYIGGEAAISMSSVLQGHHVEMAVTHGALIVALEHRFYGASINPDGLEIDNLHFLCSQHNLVDLVSFHQFISEKYSLTRKNTWISFGGSYSGSLSAWFRGKFPHLVYGAVASSAPIKAKLDFSTYNKVVGESLMNTGVGGSIKCVGAVWEAFAAVEAKLLGGNETQVAKDFGCCLPLEEPEDLTELIQGLADIVMGTVQYDGLGAPLTIERLCAIITNQSEEFEQEEEAYDRLVKLVKIYQEATQEPCLQASFAVNVMEVNSTVVDSDGFGERQWLYQTCAEFGFYQTCEDASCPFSRMLTLRSQTEMCRLLFGLSPERLPSMIAFTNTFYGGTHPQTQRVLYVNGDIDPWHELSMLQNGTVRADKDRAIVINGTAHCADMSSSHPQDPPSLKEARREIEQHVATWLKNAAWEHYWTPPNGLGDQSSE